MSCCDESPAIELLYCRLSVSLSFAVVFFFHWPICAIELSTDDQFSMYSWLPQLLRPAQHWPKNKMVSKSDWACRRRNSLELHLSLLLGEASSPRTMAEALLPMLEWKNDLSPSACHLLPPLRKIASIFPVPPVVSTVVYPSKAVKKS